MEKQTRSNRRRITVQLIMMLKEYLDLYSDLIEFGKLREKRRSG